MLRALSSFPCLLSIRGCHGLCLTRLYPATLHSLGWCPSFHPTKKPHILSLCGCTTTSHRGSYSPLSLSRSRTYYFKKISPSFLTHEDAFPYFYLLLSQGLAKLLANQPCSYSMCCRAERQAMSSQSLSLSFTFSQPFLLPDMTPLFFHLWVTDECTHINFCFFPKQNPNETTDLKKKEAKTHKNKETRRGNNNNNNLVLHQR